MIHDIPSVLDIHLEESGILPPLDHGKQNYTPLWHPLYLKGHRGDDGSLADSGIKHHPGCLRKYLDHRLIFGNYEVPDRLAKALREEADQYLAGIVHF
jgi:hypothetical protein